MSVQETGPTRSLADFVRKTTFADLPRDVVQSSKRLILDTIGSALGGYLTDMGMICLKIVKTLGGNPESTVMGSGDKTSCVNAAYANAKMANALDYDDVLYNASHLASPTVAAVLAVGERVKASGKDVLTALVLGYDLAARVGVSGVQPRLGRNVDLAWQTIGSIVASAKILELDEQGILNALGIGCANAPITCRRKSWPKTMVKYGDMGVIASQGILAALAAQMGHTGSTDVLEGDYGFWRCIGGEECDYNVLLGELGNKWYIMDSSIKPYPSCRWIHPALDLFTKIVKDNNLKPPDVRKVVIRVHRMAVEVGSIYEPKDWLAAQVSIPYNIALVAFRIQPSSEWQSPHRYKDHEILDFAKKVEVEEDPNVARILSLPEQPPFGFKRGSTSIEVVTTTETFKGRAEYAKGDPWLPDTKITDEDLTGKFRHLAYQVAGSSLSWRRRVEEIIEKTYKMEEVDDITELMMLVSSPMNKFH